MEPKNKIERNINTHEKYTIFKWVILNLSNTIKVGVPAIQIPHSPGHVQLVHQLRLD